MLLSRRVEIRQKDLAWSGMLCPGRKITSYAWDPNPVEFEILRLRTSHPMQWFPTVISVRRELRSQLDGALTRQLMEWPTRSQR
jgi:hypothetical protein